MQLYIVRHGESANNNLWSGQDYDEYMAARLPDPPLTPIGEQQAELVAEHMAGTVHPENDNDRLGGSDRPGYGIDEIYCSAMFRAMQTAKPIGRELNLSPRIWIDIHEHGGMFHGNPRNGGVTSHAGLKRDEIAEQFTGYEIPDAVSNQGWWFGGYEEIETCEARAQRVARTLHLWADERDNESAIAFVSHGTFVDRLLKALFGHDFADRRLFYQHYNTAITRIDFIKGGPLILHYLNRTRHLPPELTTK